MSAWMRRLFSDNPIDAFVARLQLLVAISAVACVLAIFAH